MKTDGIAEEDSLAENTMREALHPLDQLRAFQALRDEHGLGDEEIAARFFVTPNPAGFRRRASPTLDAGCADRHADRVRSFFLYSPAELAQSLHHHRDITYAAQLRDGELGRRAMHLHLQMSYARVIQHRQKWRQMSGAAEPVVQMVEG